MDWVVPKITAKGLWGRAQSLHVGADPGRQGLLRASIGRTRLSKAAESAVPKRQSGPRISWSTGRYPSVTKAPTTGRKRSSWPQALRAKGGGSD